MCASEIIGKKACGLSIDFDLLRFSLKRRDRIVMIVSLRKKRT